jgi:uncharacterized repeat protein (TIGR04076 family)
MIDYTIKCEAIDVRTESGICPGLAKTEKGETYELGARTPAENGICASALTSLFPMSMAMKLTDKMSWEKEDHFDVVCPHGAVTYRISRKREKN